MLTRRNFLGLAGAILSCPWQSVLASKEKFLVNDTHSRLNPTYVLELIRPQTLTEVNALVKRAKQQKMIVSICGGKHAMGGQQFATDSILIDTNKLNKVLNFDAQNGLIEVESGIQWPKLIDNLTTLQSGAANQWCIIQKPTGTDDLSLAGALSANAHGRGLSLKPIVDNIDSFSIIDANGQLLKVSRTENPELFKLAIGGYGLFGFVYSITLRLMPRLKLKRQVTIVNIEEVIPTLTKHRDEGSLYGDFQFAIDENAPTFLTEGILSTYRPVDPDTPIVPNQRILSLEDWTTLAELAHSKRGEAYSKYSQYYLATNGQVYWSDTYQLSTYIPDYHRSLDQKFAAKTQATEIISELYVPRSDLADFMKNAATILRRQQVPLIYGTVRLIEKDDETFLPWAKQAYACVIFNLHTEHTPKSLNLVANTFRSLIDLAINYGGSYYLTYHKFATKNELLACYPQFPQFLQQKLNYDPGELFQSDWYRHYKRLIT